MSELDRIVEAAVRDPREYLHPVFAGLLSSEHAARRAALAAVRRCVEEVRAEPSFCGSCAGATARAFIAAILAAFPEAQP